MRILLMGYKHAGKTSLGKRLSEELELPFIDMDQATEASYGGGKTVREIYQSEGRDFFRSLEEKVLEELLKDKAFILAGAPVHTLPVSLLRSFQHRLFIQPSEETLLKRIEASGRPAFFDAELPLHEAFQKSYESRLPAYEAAATFCIRDEDLERAVKVATVHIKRPKLAVPIRETSTQEVISRLTSLDHSVDYAELWLDWVEDLNLPAIFDAAKHPLLVVAKGADEHGRFRGSAEEKLALLSEAVQLGARFVDVDMNYPLLTELQSLTEKSFCRLILSFHDFNTTPSAADLENILRRQCELQADVCKIAVTAENRDQCFELIELLLWARKRGVPMIGTAMGEAGRLSRLLGPLLGELGFACSDEGQESAPGQMTVSDLRRLFREI